jgi:hypothetical protein
MSLYVVDASAPVNLYSPKVHSLERSLLLSRRLTFSCGLAESVLGESVKGLIERADKNMYEAKRRGRNQVVSGNKHPISVNQVTNARAD